MIETICNVPILEPADEVRQIGNILSSIRRCRKRGSMNLLLLFKADQHCAVKIIESVNNQTHLASVFARSEYDQNELPNAPLEIKVDEKSLNTENIVKSTSHFLSEHFPETLNYKITFYETLKNYKNKIPVNLQNTDA